MRYAKRVDLMKASEIREMIKLTLKPGIISFAGGLPAPEMFPVEQMKKVACEVMDESGMVAMQYSATEGYVPLREKIVDRMKKYNGIDTKVDNVAIISGSQQGIDFAGRIFLDEGDIVLFETPSYMGAFNALKSYMPEFMDVPTDDEGMKIDELERIIEQYKERIKLIYVIPDFQNPTGRTWSLQRRKDFMKVINKYEIPVIEDNPYGDLRFEGQPIDSLKSLDTKGLVIYLGSFSKILAPGYRVAWVCASDEIISKFIFAKQGADLQSSTLAQMELNKYMEMYDLDEHVEKIRELYHKRRNLMLEMMEKEFPKCVKFTYPKGGLFTWVELPEDKSARELLYKCVDENVAYVCGESFYPKCDKTNTFRMNFSTMPEDLIVEGVKRLGKAMREYLEE